MKLIVGFFKDKKNAWRFHLKSSNGKILASSEAYSSLAKARQGADVIILATQFKLEGLKKA